MCKTNSSFRKIRLHYSTHIICPHRYHTAEELGKMEPSFYKPKLSLSITQDQQSDDTKDETLKQQPLTYLLYWILRKVKANTWINSIVHFSLLSYLFVVVVFEKHSTVHKADEVYNLFFFSLKTPKSKMWTLKCRCTRVRRTQVWTQPLHCHWDAGKS